MDGGGPIDVGLPAAVDLSGLTTTVAAMATEQPAVWAESEQQAADTNAVLGIAALAAGADCGSGRGAAQSAQVARVTLDLLRWVPTVHASPRPPGWPRPGPLPPWGAAVQRPGSARDTPRGGPLLPSIGGSLPSVPLVAARPRRRNGHAATVAGSGTPLPPCRPKTCASFATAQILSPRSGVSSSHPPRPPAAPPAAPLPCPRRDAGGQRGCKATARPPYDHGLSVGRPPSGAW